MQQIMSTMIVLFSMCIVVLIGSHQLNMSFYILLIVIEYIAVLIMNKSFRENTGRFFKRKGKFGEKSKYYKAIHLENMAEDLEKMESTSFEHFISDLLEANDYKTKLIPNGKDYGVNIAAKKEKSVRVIKVQHRDSSNWEVGNEAVQQVVAAQPIYKADSSMVITNGTFTEQALTQANANHTLMLDGKQLMNMVRETICSGKECEEKEGKEVPQSPNLIK